MNNQHRKTLEEVFAEPTKSNIAWADIEALLLAAGCKIIEGSGSRIRIESAGHVAFFHRPHPQKEALRYQVKDARKLLEKLEITP
jgi:HicA toxin of bacterial toxin-antitoxin,